MSERDQYYATALSWADERVAAGQQLRQYALLVAAGAGAIAILLSLTVMLLVPLKSVQPYVVTVDRQTGAVQMATTLEGGRLTENEAVIQAELANYVRTRESFDATDLPVSSRLVQLRSSNDVRTAYVRAMATANPASPLHTLSPGDTVKVLIKSVSVTGQGAALVRYDTERSSANGQITDTRAYVSAISFGFNSRPLRMEDRFDNPLGFVVSRYRRDADGVAQ